MELEERNKKKAEFLVARIYERELLDARFGELKQL